MRLKNNWFSLAIVMLFLVAIFTPLVGAVLTEDRGLSTTEKRKLSQLPVFPRELSDVNNYIDEFEKYYNDQFGLRSFFLQSFTTVKRALGDADISSPSRNVGTKNTIKGKDGWYFLNRKWDGDPVSDYRNITLYSESKLLRAVLLIAARADWLKGLGIEYLLFFAPNKHTVYSEYLPDYIVKEGEISSWDQLNDALHRYTDVQFVDLRMVLQEGKREAAKYWKERKEEAALYFTMDSHWNGAGADIAQFALAKKIEQMFPGKIDPFKRPYEDFVMLSFTGDITLIMGGKKEEAYGPFLLSGTCTPETKKDYLQRNHETRCEKGVLTALIFNDSFFPPLKPYFADYFGRAVFRWQRMTQAEINKQVAIKKPDIVIEQRAERFLPFTPDIKGEAYNDFWSKNWKKWRNTVYKLNLKAAGGGKYRSNNVKLTYNDRKKVLSMDALTNDPMLYLTKINFRKDHLYLAKVSLISSHDTELTIFYRILGENVAYPTARYSVTVPVQKGESSVFLPLFNLNMADEMRFDPGKKEGLYQIQELEVKEVTKVRLY